MTEARKLYLKEYRKKNRLRMNEHSRKCMLKKRAEDLKAANASHYEWRERPDVKAKLKMKRRQTWGEMNYGPLSEVHVLTMAIKDELRKQKGA